ncbi:MAG TPA: biotin/lipoate A/B protein ligase family protein [Dissulfurispiraceae bacterium]|nr:biotin/lipoate A/B protein ligase family protein [Dissulfurispiraceae bacterium]
MVTWRFIESGICAAAYNMALDEAIAATVRNGDSPPTLRFYGWRQPSVSLGAFQKITDIDTSYCAAHELHVVRRPTGGRGLLHGEELTYSFSGRNEGPFSQGLLGAYMKISTAFSLGLQRLGLSVEMKTRRERGSNLGRSPLCFQATSYGELTINGKKLMGSAQKRWADGFLQQGSIPYSMDYAALAAVFPALRQRIPPGYDGIACLNDLVPDFGPQVFKVYIKESFETLFGVSLLESLPTDQEAAQAHLLSAEKYQQPLCPTGKLLTGLLCNSGI